MPKSWCVVVMGSSSGEFPQGKAYVLSPLYIQPTAVPRTPYSQALPAGGNMDGGKGGESKRGWVLISLRQYPTNEINIQRPYPELREGGGE